MAKKFATFKMLKDKLVSELAFDIVYNSEESEGFDIEENTKAGEDLSKEEVLEFLKNPKTKVKIELRDKDGEEKYNTANLVATNQEDGKTIVIRSLGDHCLALAMAVKEAKKTVQKLEINKDYPILSKKLICDLNAQLLSLRSEEVGIGKYRYKDFMGNVLDVGIKKIREDGNARAVKCVKLETAWQGNVTKKMNELVDWVNEVAFDGDRDVMTDIAEFHARFLKIHPFMEGNGRTDRLLTNYLLLINNYSVIDIPSEDKQEYALLLNYANAESEELYMQEDQTHAEFQKKLFAKYGPRTEENRYTPLKDFLERHLVKENTHQIIRKVLDYDGDSKLNAKKTSGRFKNSDPMLP